MEKRKERKKLVTEQVRGILVWDGNKVVFKENDKGNFWCVDSTLHLVEIKKHESLQEDYDAKDY
jgi:hypothetical protein